MYHVVVNQGRLRVLDSTRERYCFRSANSTIAPGHYRLPMLERFAPTTRRFGRARIFIAELDRAQIRAMVSTEHAVETIDDNLRFDGIPDLPTGKPGSDMSIHAGGDTLPATVASYAFQPLTPSAFGVRMHNADLKTLTEYLEPRLAIGQLVLLTVLASAGVPV